MYVYVCCVNSKKIGRAEVSYTITFSVLNKVEWSKPIDSKLSHNLLRGLPQSQFRDEQLCPWAHPQWTIFCFWTVGD